MDERVEDAAVVAVGILIGTILAGTAGTADVGIHLTDTGLPDGATIAVIAILLNAVVAEGPDHGLVSDVVARSAQLYQVVKTINGTGLVLGVVVLRQHVEHLLVGTVGAALNLGDHLDGIVIDAAIQRVVIYVGIAREVHLDIGVHHIASELCVDVIEYLLVGVEAVDR